MKTTWEGRLMGTFFGYKGGLTYALSDGTKWVQDDRTDEPVYRESPGARLLIDGTGKTYLDVEGTSSMVLVVPEGQRPVKYAGAF